MIYFDNSASTIFKPREVVCAVSNALAFLSANPGRSGHSAAMRAAALVARARQKCADYFGLKDSDGVIFTDNCTGALNLAILGTARRGHIVTTALEHNSVLRPLYALKTRGEASFTAVNPVCGGAVTAEAVERAIRPDTYLVAVNHVSNVTGAIAPVAEIGRLCRRRGLLFLVDGAQSGGYVDIDMDETNIDMLAIAPHKGLHAAQGVGVLLVGKRAKAALRPIRYGGTGTSSNSLTQPTDFPDGFESGTLPTPAIAGLCAAICRAEKHALFERETVAALSRRLRRGLAAIDGVKILSPENALNGIAAFNVRDYESGDVADILSSEYDVCVRGGLHCAPLAHKYLGTLSVGAVRVSLGFDNTSGEVDFFIRAVSEIAAKR